MDPSANGTGPRAQAPLGRRVRLYIAEGVAKNDREIADCGLRNGNKKSARRAHRETGWHAVCTAGMGCEYTILSLAGATKSRACGQPLRVEKNFVETGHRICSIGSRHSSCDRALLARARAVRLFTVGWALPTGTRAVGWALPTKMSSNKMSHKHGGEAAGNTKFANSR